ncbi:MAG TPA: hypothetical protein VGP06_09625 [Janthinobacterium sp.]|nr:hypothetical protein [Janthinobacterium sp.]
MVYFLTRTDKITRAPPPARENAMVYVAPMTVTPKPQSQPPKPQVAKVPPPPRQKTAVAKVQPPTRPKLETFVPPVVAPTRVLPPPPTEDMASLVEQRRKQRADSQPQNSQPAEESEADRAMRVAKANIAGAQGKNSGDDRNDSGGVFSITNQTYHSADVKFRGWNGNFKRRWLQQVTVEQGSEIDLETAIVKKMIELIRKEKPGDFIWESQRLGRNVPLSARPEDQKELEAFLLKEFFPNYRPPVGRR